MSDLARTVSDLAGGSAGRRLGLASGLAAIAVISVGVLVLATEPTATPSILPAEALGSGDLRSESEGPGLVGNPLLILAGVVALGAATAAVTALIVRIAGREG